jgi:MFS family permease
LARLASLAGDALMPVALSFAVIGQDHSPAALGLVLGAFWVSRMVFTLAGGVVADRLPRKTVMVTCDVLRAVAEGTSAALLLSGHMTLPGFLASAAVLGAASAFFGPAADAVVPELVGPADLQEASSLLNVAQGATNVFGPVLSGALVAAVGPGWVFVLDAATFVASAYLLARLRIPDRPPTAAPAAGSTGRFGPDLRDGLRAVATRAWVRAPIVGFAVSNFCFAAFVVLGPVVARERLGGVGAWGVVSTCGAIGTIAGAAISLRLRPQRPLAFGFATGALVAVPIATLAPPMGTAAVSVAWGAGMASVALCNTLWEATLQQRIPRDLLARVRSFDMLVSFVSMPLGLVLFPLIAAAAGTRPTLLAAAAAAAVSNLTLATLPPVRGLTAIAAQAAAAPRA